MSAYVDPANAGVEKRSFNKVLQKTTLPAPIIDIFAIPIIFLSIYVENLLNICFIFYPVLSYLTT